MTAMVDPRLAVARFMTFGLAMLAFGWAVFDAAIAAPASPRRSTRAVIGGALALCALAYLTLLAREASGSAAWPPLSLVAALAVSTGFGRALAATAFVGLELALWARPPNGVRPALAGLGLAALAFVGHAADGVGLMGDVRLMTMALHLLAVGAWLGALPALWQGLRTAGPDTYRRLRRFGHLGAAAVVAVLVTGAGNILFVASDTRSGFGATYLLTLVVKLAFVAGLLALAAINRFGLTPRVKLAPEPGLTLLRRTIVAEQTLAVLALASVAVLGQLDPSM